MANKLSISIQTKFDTVAGERDLQQRLQQLNSRLNLNMNLDTNRAITNVNNLNSSLHNVEKTNKRIGDSARGLVADFAGYEILTKTLGASFQNAVKLDDALRNLGKITNMTKKDLNDMQGEAFKVAKELGSSATSYINAVSEWRSSGIENMDEAKKFAKVTLESINALGVSGEQVNKMLMNMRSAYGLNADEARKAMDSVNALENKSGATANEIIASTMRNASLFADMKANINETLSLNTILIDKLKLQPESIGRSLKNLYSNLNSNIKFFNKEGIDIKQGDGVVEMLRKISKASKDGTLNAEEFNDVLKKMGGKEFILQNKTLIDNMNLFDDYVNKSKDATQSISQENKRYMDSLNGGLKQIKTTWEELTQSVVSDGEWKGLVDDLDSVLKVFLDLEKSGLHPIRIGLVAISGLLAINFASGVLDSVKNVKSLTSGMFDLSKNVGKTVTNVGEFKGALTKVPWSLFLKGGAITVAVGLVGLMAKSWWDSYQNVKKYNDELKKVDTNKANNIKSIGGMDKGEINKELKDVDALVKKHKELKLEIDRINKNPMMSLQDKNVVKNSIEQRLKDVDTKLLKQGINTKTDKQMEKDLYDFYNAIYAKKIPFDNADAKAKENKSKATKDNTKAQQDNNSVVEEAIKTSKDYDKVQYKEIYQTDLLVQKLEEYNDELENIKDQRKDMIEGSQKYRDSLHSENLVLQEKLNLIRQQKKEQEGIINNPSSQQKPIEYIEKTKDDKGKVLSEKVVNTKPSKTVSNKGGSYDYLTGKTSNVNPELLAKLNEIAKAQGKKLEISSGYRTVEHQTELYNKSNAKGKMVGSPTGSYHTSGNAVDVQSQWFKNLSNKDLAKYGLVKPMSYENWHTEQVGTRKYKNQDILKGNTPFSHLNGSNANLKQNNNITVNVGTGKQFTTSDSYSVENDIAKITDDAKNKLRDLSQEEKKILSDMSDNSKEWFDSKIAEFDLEISKNKELIDLETSHLLETDKNSKAYSQSKLREIQLIEQQNQTLHKNADELRSIIDEKSELLDDKRLLEYNNKVNEMRKAYMENLKVIREIKQEQRDLVADELSKYQEKVVKKMEESQNRTLDSLKKLSESKDSFNYDEFKDSIDEVISSLDLLDEKFINAKAITSTTDTRDNLRNIKREIMDISEKFKSFQDKSSSNSNDLERIIKNEADFADKLKDKLEDINNVIRDKTLLYKDQEATLENNIKLEEKSFDNQIEAKRKKLDDINKGVEEADRAKRAKELENELRSIKSLQNSEFVIEDANGNAQKVKTYDKKLYKEKENELNKLKEEYAKEDLQKLIQKEIDDLQKGKDERINLLRKELEQTKNIHNSEIEALRIKQQNLNNIYSLINADISSKINELSQIYEDERKASEEHFKLMIEQVKNGTMSHEEVMTKFFDKSVLGWQTYGDNVQAEMEKIASMYQQFGMVSVDNPNFSGGSGETDIQRQSRQNAHNSYSKLIDWGYTDAVNDLQGMNASQASDWVSRYIDNRTDSERPISDTVKNEIRNILEQKKRYENSSNSSSSSSSSSGRHHSSGGSTGSFIGGIIGGGAGSYIGDKIDSIINKHSGGSSSSSSSDGTHLSSDGHRYDSHGFRVDHVGGYIDKGNSRDFNANMKLKDFFRTLKSDETPSILQDGEYVVDKDTTDKLIGISPQFKQMTKDFVKGGIIGNSMNYRSNLGDYSKLNNITNNNKTESKSETNYNIQKVEVVADNVDKMFDSIRVLSKQINS